MKRVIVTQCDQNYVNQAKVALSSVFLNGGWDGDYFLLADDLLKEDIKWFKKRGVIVESPKPVTTTIFHGWPRTIWNKCYCFSPMFSDWDQIVYIDADTITQKSIEYLSNVKDLYFWSYPKSQLRSQFLDFNAKICSDYDMQNLAINSGVIAFPKSVIQHNFIDRVNEMIKNYGPIIKYPEEAILNLIFYEKWKQLPIIFNCNPSDNLGDTDRIALMHFRGKYKPWKNPYNDDEWINLWKKSLKNSDKVDFRLSPPEPKTVSQEDIDYYTKCEEQQVKKITEKIIKNEGRPGYSSSHWRRKIIKQGVSLPRLFGSIWQQFYRMSINETFRIKNPNPYNCNGGTLYLPSFYAGRGTSN